MSANEPVGRVVMDNVRDLNDNHEHCRGHKRQIQKNLPLLFKEIYSRTKPKFHFLCDLLVDQLVDEENRTATIEFTIKDTAGAWERFSLSPDYVWDTKDFGKGYKEFFEMLIDLGFRMEKPVWQTQGPHGDLQEPWINLEFS